MSLWEKLLLCALAIASQRASLAMTGCDYRLSLRANRRNLKSSTYFLKLACNTILVCITYIMGRVSKMQRTATRAVDVWPLSN